VQRHEHFEELCAAASIGQVSGEDLAELQEHLNWCSACQDCYAEFVALNAGQYATNVKHQELGHEEAVSFIDSALFRERFLRKATAEGIVFSSPAKCPMPAPETRLPSIWNRRLLFASTVAALVLLASAAAYYFGTYEVRATTSDALAVALPATVHEGRKLAVTNLERENRDLTQRIVFLKASLDSAFSHLSELKSNHSASERDRLSLEVQLKEGEDTLAALQTRLEQAQATIATLRSDYENARTTVASNQASMAEDGERIHQLSEQLAESSASLARERELLTAGRDVRELMAARNLHIVDVFDTDPKGKTRPAFGRIFYTEGKSLLFYAYDMPDARLEDAGYHYRIWGKKEGPNQAARSLGIFFSDDKAQKRWVFQYDDPKVLNEIDSVFVTLEPPDRDAKRPKGDKLLYAYLKGQANHP
jgi:exonuclease VII small subunit